MKLHQRGIDLLLSLHDAIDHADKLSSSEIQALLTEAISALQHLLARDVPTPEKDVGLE